MDRSWPIAFHSSKLLIESPLPSITENDEPIMVGPEDIVTVASVWSGIPVKHITANERMLLIGLDEMLKKRVIGQDNYKAVAAISRVVKRSRVGLKDPNRPIVVQLRLAKQNYQKL
ncbi:EARLY RESPONSIVE TO DEHYDRATION 1, SENESCENCE ASSOCIATED GENE 15 [Hibiscus trionum]|uniref:EARLY RESPONSIVE TO DEHYDRATION 1, SENESCENCE ASSOCIATED GENE 15 n=1 Tax=Hibiscus trionum TaxID=183268 RepID=A0A9W7HYR4_HIBTR|nr:EARLY RESPONSIVE TO DEHYDRATION 1, SENESCENCE ASSOCIATED GENE 15 [Hibiscus trionum]